MRYFTNDHIGHSRLWHASERRKQALYLIAGGLILFTSFLLN